MIIDSQSPVIKAVDHVALTVPEMEGAIEFYTDVVGASVLYRMGPFDAAEIPPMPDGRDWTQAHVNVAGARLEITMLQLSENLKLELFQYHKPDDSKLEPSRNCDVGSAHICFCVDDVHSAVKYFTSNGCHAMAGPITMEDGPCPPSKSWYLLDPFGLQMELVEYL